ncbi:MAG: hypothetical protein GC200_05090 [Tepidisphaera sp.]|nr:hypothetical protein [Tepidisphaera sp.]
MPKPARLGALPSHSFIGGLTWDPLYVYWGERGRAEDDAGGNPKRRALYGQRIERGAGGRGGASNEEREYCKIDLWEITAVYALLRDGRLVYAGEGALGKRLKEHWDNPQLQWDQFTWIAPAQYTYPVGDHAGFDQPNPVAVNLTPKQFSEFLEMVIIHTGKPTENSQDPEQQGTPILWLDQVEDERAPGRIEDQLAKLLARLPEK